jgi:CheY-like chemotaxis protein
LNGRADSKGYPEIPGAARFTFPQARLLVVDDIATNLKVAEGLLAPCRAAVDTCLNGFQAIELVKQAASQERGYDIVFMDHRMSEMDGIETTAAIRAWEKEQQKENQNPRGQIPIIALTANAVVGMREMFIENGFNDFLSKPIDVSKLDEMLERWIPGEKREERLAISREQLAISNEQLAIGREQLAISNEQLAIRRERQVSDNIHHSSLLIANCSLSPIPGVDTAKGVAMTGGTEAAYKQVLSLLCKDAQDRLPLLKKIPEADALPAFVTNVHALKSALASAGAGEISAQAAELEAAGKATDMAFIRENLPVFARTLEELIKNIRTALQLSETAVHSSESFIDHSSLLIAHSSLFKELAEALKSQNTAEIDRILEELSQKPMSSKIRKALEKISDDVLVTEFDSALKTIAELEAL